MNIGVTGPHGSVGKVLVNRGGITLDFHITKDAKDTIDNIRKAIIKASPDIIINTISKTDVNWCEEREHAEEVILVNTRGLYYIALVCEQLKIPLIALSTDHIFDGKRGPYKEDGRKMLPVNFYGASKLAMETLALSFDGTKVIRTSNLFCKDTPTIVEYLDKAYKYNKVKVPGFQKRSFMHIEHFVDSLLWCTDRFDRMPKTLNVSGSKTVSWLNFLKEYAEVIDFPFRNKFARKWFDDKDMIPRPKKAGLDTSLSAKLGMKQYSYVDGLEMIKDA